MSAEKEQLSTARTESSASGEPLSGRRPKTSPAGSYENERRETAALNNTEKGNETGTNGSPTTARSGGRSPDSDPMLVAEARFREAKQRLMSLFSRAELDLGGGRSSRLGSSPGISPLDAPGDGLFAKSVSPREPKQSPSLPAYRMDADSFVLRDAALPEPPMPAPVDLRAVYRKELRGIDPDLDPGKHKRRNRNPNQPLAGRHDRGPAPFDLRLGPALEKEHEEMRAAALRQKDAARGGKRRIVQEKAKLYGGPVWERHQSGASGIGKKSFGGVARPGPVGRLQALQRNEERGMSKSRSGHRRRRQGEVAPSASYPAPPPRTALPRYKRAADLAAHQSYRETHPRPLGPSSSSSKKRESISRWDDTSSPESSLEIPNLVTGSPGQSIPAGPVTMDDALLGHDSSSTPWLHDPSFAEPTIVEDQDESRGRKVRRSKSGVAGSGGSRSAKKSKRKSRLRSTSRSRSRRSRSRPQTRPPRPAAIPRARAASRTSENSSDTNTFAVAARMSLRDVSSPSADARRANLLRPMVRSPSFASEDPYADDFPDVRARRVAPSLMTAGVSARRAANINQVQ